MASLLRRTAPLAVLLAATLAGCAGDPIPPPELERHATPPPAALPDTDDVLEISRESRQQIDYAISGITADDVGLTVEDVRTLEETATASADHELGISIDHHAWEDAGAWVVWSKDDQSMTRTTITLDLTTVLDSEEWFLDDEPDGSADAVAIVREWDLTLTEAATTATDARPGEIMMTMTPDEPVPVLIVVVREDDGTLVRVGIDGRTAEALNAVESWPPGTGSDHEQEDDTPAPPCTDTGCGDPGEGSTSGTPSSSDD